MKEGTEIYRERDEVRDQKLLSQGSTTVNIPSSNPWCDTTYSIFFSALTYLHYIDKEGRIFRLYKKQFSQIAGVNMTLKFWRLQMLCNSLGQCKNLAELAYLMVLWLKLHAFRIYYARNIFMTLKMFSPNLLYIFEFKIQWLD